MPHAGVLAIAGLISGASAALILASGPSYTEPRSLQGAVYDAKWGQSTFGACRASPCQIAYLNSVEDFCLWAPSQPALSAVRNTEHTLVAWCMKGVHGTRLIPDGTISEAHLVTTSEYIQITGSGNFTNINVPVDGIASVGEEGDHIPGLVFTSAYGQLEQIYDWTGFMSQEQFCFRACRASAATSAACQKLHDISGCSEILPEKYDPGVLKDCIGDSIEVPSTLYQKVLLASSHYSAYSPSSCPTRGTVGDGQATRAKRALVPVLVTSLSYLPFRSHSHSTPATSSLAPTATDNATSVTFPSFPTLASTATTFVNSSTAIPSNAPTLTSYSYNYTRSRWHSQTHRFSHHHTTTSTASPSSYPSFSSSPSSSTASSINGSSSTSSVTSSLVLSTPSLTFTSPTSSGSSGMPTSSATSTSTPTPTSSFSSSYAISPPSSPASPSTSSSTSSQSSYVLTFTTPSSSVPTTFSPPSSSSTVPNSQTQIGSQCPPPVQIVVNAGFVVPSSPLLSLMLTILMVVFLVL